MFIVYVLSGSILNIGKKNMYRCILFNEIRCYFYKLSRTYFRVRRLLVDIYYLRHNLFDTIMYIFLHSVVTV